MLVTHEVVEILEESAILADFPKKKMYRIVKLKVRPEGLKRTRTVTLNIEVSKWKELKQNRLIDL